MYTDFEKGLIPMRMWLFKKFMENSYHEIIKIHIMKGFKFFWTLNSSFPQSF